MQCTKTRAGPETLAPAVLCVRACGLAQAIGHERLVPDELPARST